MAQTRADGEKTTSEHGEARHKKNAPRAYAARAKVNGKVFALTVASVEGIRVH